MANWIGHNWHRNCILNHVIKGKTEGKTDVTRRRARRCKKLLDKLKEGKGYWKLKKEALDHTRLRTGFGIGFGPRIRQTTE
jgi:hypothetical protein